MGEITNATVCLLGDGNRIFRINHDCVFSVN
mgnify:CR=1 FL=1